jgi:hypothetical protein
MYISCAVSCGDTYGILIRNVELAVLVPKVRAGLPRFFPFLACVLNLLRW